MGKKKFTSDYQPAKRSGGSSSFYRDLQKALNKLFEEGQVEGFETFQDWLAFKAIMEGGVYLQLVVHRVAPGHKPTLAPVEFEFSPNGTAIEKANAVYAAMASGEIAPDVGQIFIDALSKMLNIEELTDLKERLALLEQQINKN